MLLFLFCFSNSPFRSSSLPVTARENISGVWLVRYLKARVWIAIFARICRSGNQTTSERVTKSFISNSQQSAKQSLMFWVSCCRSLTIHVHTRKSEFSVRIMEHANLVPRAFPLKNGWVGPTHFLREKPWGRSWEHAQAFFYAFQRKK